MGKETNISNPQSSREVWIKRAGPLIRTAVEKGVVGTEIDYPQNFFNEFDDAIRETTPEGKRKYSIFVVSRHNSHPDGFIIARLTLDLKARANDHLPPSLQTKGFIMPLAQSLEEGHQDKPIMRVYHEIKPVMKTFGLVPAPIVRAKDQQTYNMKRDENEDARMRELLNDGYDNVVLFPEGTTTSGKTKADGSLYGMVPFEDNSIKRTHLFLKRNLGTETLIIPTATFGGRELLNPDNKWINPRILFTAFASPLPRISSIKVGMPLRSDQGELHDLLKGSIHAGMSIEERKAAKQNDTKALNEYLGRIIAQMLPANERGVYGETTIFPGES